MIHLFDGGFKITSALNVLIIQGENLEIFFECHCLCCFSISIGDSSVYGNGDDNSTDNIISNSNDNNYSNGNSNRNTNGNCNGNMKDQ